MKAFTAILFSLFFLLTTMQQATFLLLYKLNEKSITEKYCVNKMVPGTCCHGKCHLNKTMAKSERDTKNPFSTTNIKIKEVEVILLQLQKETLFLQHSIQPFLSNYSSALLDGSSFSLIKPPVVLG